MSGVYSCIGMNVPEVSLDNVFIIGPVHTFPLEPYFFIYYKNKTRQKIFVSKQSVTKKLRQEADSKHIISPEELKKWKISVVKECRRWLSGCVKT